MPHQYNSSPFTRLLLLVFGFLVSFLPLTRFPDAWLAPVIVGFFFALAVIMTIYAASLVGGEKGGRKDETASSWARWLTLSLAVLGVGLGILAHIYRVWLDAAGLYAQTHLDSDRELFLASMLLLGLIMGFYVVRNWLKTEEEFIKSLTAVAGGAFLASILGLSAQGLTQPARTEPPAGEADVRQFSQGVNMMSAFAHYSVGFGLSALVNLLIYAALTSRYSATLSSGSRALIYFLYGVDKAKALDDYFLQNFEKDRGTAKTLLVATLRQLSEKVLLEYARKMESKRVGAARSAPASGPKFYRLISIEGEAEPTATAARADAAAVAEDEKLYNVKLEELTKEAGGVTPEMFRMGISVVTPDNLEYIVAPGEYKQPFPLRGSVAGLALRARQTIVMSRDRLKRFRTKDDRTSVFPEQIDADRGFEEVDYLSYVLLPVVSRYGDREEFPLGIISVDTKLFVATSELKCTEVVKDGQTILVARARLKDLRGYANNLYDENDAALKYLEEMRAVAVPLLELYLKCRQGAP